MAPIVAPIAVPAPITVADVTNEVLAEYEAINPTAETTEPPAVKEASTLLRFPLSEKYVSMSENIESESDPMNALLPESNPKPTIWETSKEHPNTFVFA
jgi:hypothetical protein